MELGSLSRSSISKIKTQPTYKIPDYAKDFKNEWLYIRGINKKCGEFINRIDFVSDIFNSPSANCLKKYIRKILRAEEFGKIKDISGLIFKYYDVSNI